MTAALLAMADASIAAPARFSALARESVHAFGRRQNSIDFGRFWQIKAVARLGRTGLQRSEVSSLHQKTGFVNELCRKGKRRNVMR